MSSIFAVFGTMLFTVNVLRKTDPTVICVHCMFEHACYEPVSLKFSDLEDISC